MTSRAYCIAPGQMLVAETFPGVRPHFGDMRQRGLTILSAPAEQCVGEHARAVDSGRAMYEYSRAVLEKFRDRGQRGFEAPSEFTLGRPCIRDRLPNPFDTGSPSRFADRRCSFTFGQQRDEVVTASFAERAEELQRRPVPERKKAGANRHPANVEIGVRRVTHVRLSQRLSAKDRRETGTITRRTARNDDRTLDGPSKMGRFRRDSDGKAQCVHVRDGLHRASMGRAGARHSPKMQAGGSSGCATSARRGVDLAEIGRFCGWRGGTAPPALSACARELIPGQGEGGDAIVAVLRTVGNGMADFLEAIEENDPTYARFPPTRNIELLELVTDELGARAAEAEQLMASEIQRQKDDLRALEAPIESGMIDELKEKARGVDLFGTPWFD